MDAPSVAGPVDLSDAIKSFGGYRFDSFSVSSEPKEAADTVSLMSAEAISEEAPAASLQQEVDALKAALVKDGVYASIDEIDADLDDYRDLAGQIDELNAKLKSWRIRKKTRTTRSMKTNRVPTISRAPTTSRAPTISRALTISRAPDDQQGSDDQAGLR